MTTASVRMPAKLVPVFTGEADVRGAFGGRGSGKCLGKGTMLLRHDASLVAVEDVRVGDLLLGPDGAPRTVLSTAQGIGPLYQVTQATGMSFVVNDAHILVLERSDSSAKDYGTFSAAGNPQRANGRYAGYDTGKGYSLITAEEYAAKPERFKAQHYGFRRAVVGVHKALPVDPYLLGVWLGDGSSAAAEITNIDPEIVDFIHEAAAENGWRVQMTATDGKAPRYYLGSEYRRAGSFRSQLREAGVFRDKHIPEEYFGASIEQRRSLLAGIVDTDGHVSTGCISISQSREALLNDIVRLAHGLGLKASKRYKVAMCGAKPCDSWNAQIGGDIDLLPLKIERKRIGAQVTKNKDWRRTRVDVEPIGTGAYYGFELDGDHLFMLADGTVTHNTRTFAKMTAVRAHMWDMAGRDGIILCTRQYMNSLAESSMEEIKAAIREEEWLAPHFDIGEKYIRTVSGRISYAFSGLDRNIDSIKSKSRILVNWTDEAEPVTDEAWTKLIPTLREEDSELWLTWNPERKSSATNKRFRFTDDPRMKISEMNWRDNPWFPDILNRQRLRDFDLRPDSYGHIWEGDFLTVFEGAYYAKSLAKAKAEKRIGIVQPDPLMQYWAFWDIGTRDATAIWVAQFVGRQILVLDYYEAVGQPLGVHLSWLRDNGYAKATCVLPHDGANQNHITAQRYVDHVREAGFEAWVVKNQGKGAAMQRVEAGRRMFPSCYFNEETCQGGIEALGAYHERRDEKREIGLGPEHDWASHGADAFGLMCIAKPLLVDGYDNDDEPYEPERTSNSPTGY